MSRRLLTDKEIDALPGPFSRAFQFGRRVGYYEHAAEVAGRWVLYSVGGFALGYGVAMIVMVMTR